jgi:putative ABC transport system ATP-binding protein
MAKNLISLTGLNLTYNLGASNAFTALHDVSVDIEEGDFAIILGPSGCGKSSLLNIVAGLELPEDGTVMVKDKNLFKLKEKERVEYHRREIGMIFQAYNLISTLNVLDNVALPQIFINKRKKERDQRSMQILERLGISEHAKKVPSELSGGQQQRIGIARSIINDPQIVLADEPVGNLDTASSNNVMEILNKLNTEEGKTIVMVTHNPEHASWGNRIIHMRDGKITKVEIKDREGNIKKENREGDVSSFDKFVNHFQGLSKKQIKMLLEPFKAKHLVEKLTTLFQEGQLAQMEQKTKNRLSGKIDKNIFYTELDKPEKEGGVGLDSRSAKQFSEEVENMLVIAKKISKESDGRTKAFSIMEAVFKLRNYKTSKENLNKAAALLAKKFNKEIDHKEFKRLLDAPLSKSGAGIDSRIIGEIIEFIDLIQIISYGLNEK